MSLANNSDASQGRIRHLANTLIRLLQKEVPALTTGAIITTQLINQVGEILRRHMMNLLGSAFFTAGFLTLLPSILVTVVNVLGFTAGGVVNGSVAALIQSIFYGSQTGGLFSILQAFGATAVISSPVVIGLGITLVVAGAGICGYKLWRRYHEKQRIDQDEGSDDDDHSNPYTKHSSSHQVVKSPRRRNFWDFFR